MKPVKEKQFFIKRNDIHSIEITVSDKGIFKVMLHGRELYKDGIKGSNRELNFRLDYENRTIVLIRVDKTEEILKAEKTFDYYFMLMEYNCNKTFKNTKNNEIKHE